MSEDRIDCEMREWSLVGNDTVVFRLNDGAIVKVKVDLVQAGRAINFRNPDGTPHYVIGSNVNIAVLPPEKERVFRIQKSKIMPASNDKVPAHIV